MTPLIVSLRARSLDYYADHGYEPGKLSREKAGERRTLIHWLLPKD